MEQTIKRWGNSAAVRIPAGLLSSAGLAVDQRIIVREAKGRIIIEPAQERPLTLAALVRGITEQNRHSETDWGAPVGNEAW